MKIVWFAKINSSIPHLKLVFFQPENYYDLHGYTFINFMKMRNTP